MSHAIELARRYFELSNQADLPAIKQLFTSSSTYSSINTGVYLGVDQILDMQTKFFAGFVQLHWQIHSVEEVRPNVVLLDFTLHGTRNDDTQIEQHGLEYVIVFNGKLQHVEVRAKP